MLVTIDNFIIIVKYTELAEGNNLGYSMIEIKLSMVLVGWSYR
jgi:hypothetical protein